MTITTSNGSAIAGTDYVTFSQALVSRPDSPLRLVTIPLIDGSPDEPDETFTVTLSDPENAIIQNDPQTGRFEGIGTVTIRDDDPAPSISDRRRDLHGRQRRTLNAVSRSRAPPARAARTCPSPTRAQTAARSPGRLRSRQRLLSFAPGETSKTIVVPISGDGAVEADQTFLLNLSGPTNVTIADGSAQGTIVNDDSELVLGADAATAATSTSASTTATSASPARIAVDGHIPNPGETVRELCAHRTQVSDEGHLHVLGQHHRPEPSSQPVDR